MFSKGEQRMKSGWKSQYLASSTCLLLLALAVAAPNAAPVVSVTLSPATITGGTGGVAIGTVTISAPAPAVGQVINLTSSNTDLAASTPSIVIPEGATSATFTVGTNSLYRPYSGLAFNATITATNPGDGSSASATLNVTAQAIPGPFTGGTVSTQANATAGRMCGGSFGTGQASERGILYRCEFPQAGQFSVCSFQQECAFGCQTQSAPNLNRNDVCRTTPPFPVAVAPELLEGGRRSDGTVFVTDPANSLTQANVSSSPIGEISPGGGFPVPQGQTTAPFDVDTMGVAVPAFLGIRADLSLNPQTRFGQDFLAVVPVAGTAPPSGPLGVFAVEVTPMSTVQGLPSIGTVVLNGVAPSGGAVVSLFSNNPAAVPPASVTVDAGTTATSFNVATDRVTADTLVTITATFGGQSRTTTVTVSPFVFATETPALSTLSVNPSSVTAGTQSVGRVTVTGPAPDPSNGVVSVALTSSNPAVAVVRRNVEVRFGGTFADFRIRTFAVASPTTVTITGTFNGVSRSATLTVNPGGGPPPPPPPSASISAVSVNPTSVVGGNPSTGTVTLTAAAPTGGAVVSLSDDSPSAATPASVTVPAGATGADFTITTMSVTASTPVTISAVFAGVTRTATLTVNPDAPPPPPGPLPAPSQLSPADDARFPPGTAITFDWSDVAGAASYTLQIDDSETFPAPLIVSQTTTASQFTTSTLPTTRMWWRVRANDASGAPGAWSPARRFEVKQ
jgi:hypothetical protein